MIKGTPVQARKGRDPTSVKKTPWKRQWVALLQGSVERLGTLAPTPPPCARKGNTRVPRPLPGKDGGWQPGHDICVMAYDTEMQADPSPPRKWQPMGVGPP